MTQGLVDKLSPRDFDFGKPVKIYDFKGGMVTQAGKEMIQVNEASYLKNVISDRKNVLSKIWGTAQFHGATDDDFCDMPVYSGYRYVTYGNKEFLLVQGKDSGTMKLWYIDKPQAWPDSSSPTTLTSSSIHVNRRLRYATYKGRVYFTDGVNPLRYWDGNVDSLELVAQNELNANTEPFTYICTHNGRLFQAYSPLNPTRVIWTGIYGEWFKGPGYYDHFPGETHFMDVIGKGDYSPITHITGYRQFFIVFKARSIYAVTGDFDANNISGLNFQCISQGIGTLWDGSVQLWNDLIFFMWEDGVYILGDSSVMADFEDRRVKSQSNVVRVSSQIDNYWKDQFTIPTQDTIATTDNIKRATDCMMNIDFTSGSCDLPYDTPLIGNTNAGTFIVTSMTVENGSFSAGTAAGSMIIRNPSGTFSGEETFKIDDIAPHDNVLTISSAEATKIANAASTYGHLYGIQFTSPPISTDRPNLLTLCFMESAVAAPGDTLSFKVEDPQNIDQAITDYENLRSSSGEDQYYGEIFIPNLPSNPPQTGDPQAVPYIFAPWITKVTGGSWPSNIRLKVQIKLAHLQSGRYYPHDDVVFAEGQSTYLGDIEGGLAFDGGVNEMYPGDTLTADSGGTFEVVHVMVTGGSWGDEDATGYLTYKSLSGTIADDDDLSINGTKMAVQNGEESSFVDGCFVPIQMTYWPMGVGIMAAQDGDHRYILIQVFAENDTDTEYVRWAYTANQSSFVGQVWNSSSYGSSTNDYKFILQCNAWLNTNDNYLITPKIDGGDSVDFWGPVIARHKDDVDISSVEIEHDDFADYTRNTKLDKVYWADSSDGTSWSGWTEITNAGVPNSANRYIKFKFVWHRPTVSAAEYMDTCRFESVLVTSSDSSMTDVFISSCIWENRYILNIPTITDKSTQDIN